MSNPESLKVFISWSGNFSREVALLLRGWLLNLSDRVEPWVSDVDIESGARSMDELSAELDGTRFGIVIVTQENQGAPWLNFEAGALSKQVQGNKSHVVPLLMDMGSPTELTGPMSQYQAVVFKKSGLKKLLVSVASGAGVEEITMMNRFEKYWPDLDDQVSVLRDRHAQRGPGPSRRSERELAEETLERIRTIERLLEATNASSPRATFASSSSLGLQKPPLEQVPMLVSLRRKLIAVGATEVLLGPEFIVIALPDDWSSLQESRARELLAGHPGLQIEWLAERDFVERYGRHTNL